MVSVNSISVSNLYFIFWRVAVPVTHNTFSTLFLIVEEVGDGSEGQVADVLELLHQVLLEGQDVGKELHEAQLCFLTQQETTCM